MGDHIKNIFIDLSDMNDLTGGADPSNKSNNMSVIKLNDDASNEVGGVKGMDLPWSIANARILPGKVQPMRSLTNHEGQPLPCLTSHRRASQKQAQPCLRGSLLR